MIISSSAIVTTLLIFLMGDINVHFFAIIGIPLFLVYRADKRRKTRYDKKFRLGRFSKKKENGDSKS